MPDPVFNKVTAISADGKTISLAMLQKAVPGVNFKTVTAGIHQFFFNGS